MRSLLLMPGILPALLMAQEDQAWRDVRSSLDRGRVYAAIRSCDRQLAGKGPDQRFLVLRAEARNRIGEYERARTDAMRAAALLQGDLYRQAQLQWGIAQFHLSGPDSAMVHYDLALGGSDDGPVWYRIGLVHKAAGRCAEAIGAFDRALALRPADPSTLRERGGCHAALGDTAAARADLDSALAIAPRDPAHWNARGFELHARTGRWAEAVKDYDRAIKLDPNYSFAFNNRGWARYQLGDERGALRDINLAQRKNRRNPFVYRNLGMIALAKDDPESACAHFRRALELGYTRLHGTDVAGLVKARCKAVKPVGAAPADAPKENPRQGRGNAP
jgi:tetratricopeptide (TPR) repeat protein